MYKIIGAAIRKSNTYSQIFNSVKLIIHLKEVFIEPQGELSIAHTHDKEELCHIVEGEMEFLNGFEKFTLLKANNGIIIKANRLHGVLISSGQCVYEIYHIKDSKKWL